MKKIILVLTLLFSGCAYTNVCTIHNPNFKNVNYKKIMIEAPIKDLATRKTTEHNFVLKFSEINVTAVASIDIIPPFKEYTEKELLEIYKKNSIDAVMIVTITGVNTYIPQSSYPSVSVSFGKSRTIKCEEDKKPIMNFEIKLYDIPSGETVWMATSVTRGSASATIDTFTSSLAGEIVLKYKEELQKP